jgi:threonine/homoserine/homoserine lactone efflux protein
MLVSFIIFSLIAILSGFIANYLKSHKNAGKVLKWLQIIVFVGIAVFLLISEK